MLLSRAKITAVPLKGIRRSKVNVQEIKGLLEELPLPTEAGKGVEGMDHFPAFLEASLKVLGLDVSELPWTLEKGGPSSMSQDLNGEIEGLYIETPPEETIPLRGGRTRDDSGDDSPGTGIPQDLQEVGGIGITYHPLQGKESGKEAEEGPYPQGSAGRTAATDMEGVKVQGTSHLEGLRHEVLLGAVKEVFGGRVALDPTGVGPHQVGNGPQPQTSFDGGGFGRSHAVQGGGSQVAFPPLMEVVRPGEVVHRLEVQLWPPHLGKLRLKVRVKGEEIRAIILTEGRHQKAVLEAGIPQLKQVLVEKGFQVKELAVFMNMNPQGEGHIPWGEAPGEDIHFSWAEEGVEGDEEVEPPLDIGSSISDIGGVDIHA